MGRDARSRPGSEDRTLERVGWGLFGSWRRLQVGMWIATLPGSRQPRTFTVAEYWNWLKEKEMPGWGVSVRADLNRFVTADMLQERPEMSAMKRCQHWTRLDSPMWNVFSMAAIVLGEHEFFVQERRRLTVNDLSRLRDELIRAQLVDACICPAECDCQRPPTHLSNLCPHHNDVPDADEECPASEHRNGAR